MIRLILIVLMICFSLLLVYDVNIYQLLSRAKVYDYISILQDKYSKKNAIIKLYLTKDVIYSQAGKYDIDLSNNVITITSGGTKYTFNIDDVPSYIGMIYEN